MLRMYIAAQSSIAEKSVTIGVGIDELGEKLPDAKVANCITNVRIVRTGDQSIIRLCSGFIKSPVFVNNENQLKSFLF